MPETETMKQEGFNKTFRETRAGNHETSSQEFQRVAESEGLAIVEEVDPLQNGKRLHME
jgi:hypothetical protein